MPQKEIVQSKDNEDENGDYLFPEIDDSAFEETMDSAIAEIMEKHRSANDDESIEKAVSTEDIASAKSRGLVPQSGNWEKPKRWVRPEDADVPVKEENPRKKANFYPDKLRRNFGNKLTPIEMEEELTAFFGEDVKPSVFADVYSTGLDDYFTDIMDIHLQKESIPPVSLSDYTRDRGSNRSFDIDVVIGDSSTEASVGHMSRRFEKDKDGNILVYHKSFEIDKEAQGKGIASDMNENVEKEYEKLGVSEIRLTANGKIGGYAWAVQGYDFSDYNELEEIADRFEISIEVESRSGIDIDIDSAISEIEGFEHSWEFALWNPTDAPYGEHLGKKFMLGSGWDAKKSLDKKSLGYQIGKAYFAAKRNEKNIS